MKAFLLVGIGGFLGAMARYGVSLVIPRLITTGLPLATLLVNVVGSFLLGLVMADSAKPMGLSESTRLLIGVGFLGALTTFSTFSYENLKLFQQGAYVSTLLNIFLNLILCLLAAYGGYALKS